MYRSTQQQRPPDVEIEDGVVRVGPDLMTGRAGGDIVPAERTVTVGIGHGRTAALRIDAYLGGTARERDADTGGRSGSPRAASRSPRPGTRPRTGRSPYSSRGRSRRREALEARRGRACSHGPDERPRPFSSREGLGIGNRGHVAPARPTVPGCSRGSGCASRRSVVFTDTGCAGLRMGRRGLLTIV